jgi:hypothetical protein
MPFVIRDLKATSAFYFITGGLQKTIDLSAKLKGTALIARMALIILIGIF